MPLPDWDRGPGATHRDLAAAAHESECAHELAGPRVHAEYDAVEVDEVGVGRVDLLAREQRDVLHAEVEGQAVDGAHVHVRGHVREQREVLDEAAALTLGRVARTQHAPLTRLQTARPTHLARLLELTLDARHHAQTRDEGQPRQGCEGPVSTARTGDEAHLPCVMPARSILKRLMRQLPLLSAETNPK